MVASDDHCQGHRVHRTPTMTLLEPVSEDQCSDELMSQLTSVCQRWRRIQPGAAHVVCEIP